jgi:PEP-CTERM motif
MQSTHNTPLAAGSRRDPALLRFPRGSVMGMMRTATVALLVLTGIASTPGIVNADITYTVEDNTQAISGSITTDGQIGALSASDILQWQIHLTESGLTISGTGALVATGVSASASEIQVDLTGIDNGLELQQDSTNYALWELSSPTSLVATGQAMSGTSKVEYAFEISATGTTATIASVTSVPEPSTATFAVLGAVAFIAYGWRRHSNGRPGHGPEGPAAATR